MNEKKKNSVKWQYYVVIAIICVQFYDSYSSELYSRVQSLYITEYLIDGRDMEAGYAVAYLNNVMLPCYLFIMLAPAFRTLADRIGRRILLIVNVIGITVGVAICAKSQSFLVFIVGNTILNFSYTLDIQNFYILEEIPQKRQGLIKGISTGGAMLAAVSISFLRKVFVKHADYGWRNLYKVAVGAGIFLCILVFFLPETKAYQASNTDSVKKRVSFKMMQKKYHVFFAGKERYLALILLFGVATAGITFYNEPMMAFGGFDESALERILAIQAFTSLIVMTIGGGYADRYDKRKAASRLLLFAMVGSVVFIGMLGIIRKNMIVGIAYGCMIGGFWGAYHLLELNILETIPVCERGEGSAMLTYIYGIGDGIGILLCTVLLQIIPLSWLKLLLVAPIYTVGFFLLKDKGYDINYKQM